MSSPKTIRDRYSATARGPRLAGDLDVGRRERRRVEALPGGRGVMAIEEAAVERREEPPGGAERERGVHERILRRR
jgi:hypothetical protein